MYSRFHFQEELGLWASFDFRLLVNEKWSPTQSIQVPKSRLNNAVYSVHCELTRIQVYALWIVVILCQQR